MTGLEARESAVVVVISEVAVVVIITSSVVYNVCGEEVDLFLLPLTWIVFTSTTGYFYPGPRVISPIFA